MDKPGRGRKRKTSDSEDKMIFVASASSPEASSARLMHILEVQGVKILAMTIQRRLHEAGFICASPLLKPLLTKYIIKNVVLPLLVRTFERTGQG